MAQQLVLVTQNFASPVDKVFQSLADHNALGRVLGVPVKRIRDGDAEPNGVGSVRRIGPWPLGTQETVTEFEPNQHIAYRISRFGGPILRHQGRVSFCDEPTGVRVEWRIEFDSFPPLVGDAMRHLLQAAVTRGLAKLAAQLS